MFQAEETESAKGGGGGGVGREGRGGGGGDGGWGELIHSLSINSVCNRDFEGDIRRGR